MALVNSQPARNFLELISTDAGRRATMGRYRDYRSQPATTLHRLHTAVGDAAMRLKALANDKTRSLAERHQAGRQLSDKTVQEVSQAREKLQGWVDRENQAAMNEITETLKGDSDTAGQVMRSEIRAFCLSRKGDPEFVGELRGLVETDIRFANAVLEAPAALSGLKVERQQTLRMAAAVAHCPDAASRIEVAQEIAELDAKLASVAAEIPRAFYSPRVADGVQTRVDIDAPFTQPVEGETA